ncbi:MAG: DUF1002 domain-containing protein [Clostridium sp.]|uniref:DUF1002 domain-containing protein n=1 Tax=Clostridium TaxID=1485 RepID=UPI00215269D0|nr:DUF1002 domain-containing protein [Clostridium sp. LY3-2]MCR6515848.1 DUF1002 domain-containing protein [Clostridium sp. LY3-2]
MKIKKLIIILGISTTIFFSSFVNSFADQFNVVTLGANLTQQQKDSMLKYFNAKDGSYQLITVNNKEERDALKGIAPLSEIGNKTISCSYVQPTSSGSGINVKTANLTWVTASMISNTLVTAGVNDANVIAAAPFQVSGTGALTGILKGFEDSTGEKLDKNKKELANQELVTTGNIANDSKVGQEKAAAIVNDVKKEVIKDKAQDPNKVEKIINNVTNNYNITLPEAQQKELNDLMVKIGKEGYNYDQLKSTLNDIGNNIKNVLEQSGQAIKDSGFFQNLWQNIKDFFGSENKGNGNDKDLGIINQTDNSALGDSAVVTGNNTEIKDTSNNTKDSQNNNQSQASNDEGFFEKIANWFKGLFN